MSKQQDRGLIQWLKRISSFGFIQAEDGSADVFTHYTSEDPIDNEGQHQPNHQRRRRRRQDE
ncbi:MAG: cold shock domain-containing protein [Candidatus Promineifilaceae bacterium]